MDIFGCLDHDPESVEDCRECRQIAKWCKELPNQPSTNAGTQNVSTPRGQALVATLKGLSETELLMLCQSTLARHLGTGIEINGPRPKKRRRYDPDPNLPPLCDIHKKYRKGCKFCLARATALEKKRQIRIKLGDAK